MKNALLLMPVILLFSLNSHARFSKEGNQSAVNPVLQWTVHLQQPFYASPVIHGDQVFIGGNDSIFRALWLRNGKEAWKLETEGQIQSTASVAGDRILFSNGAGVLYCLNLSGNVLWKFNGGAEKPYDFADYHQSSPLVVDNTVYWGSGSGYFYAINYESGQFVWKFKADGIIHSTPAADEHSVYFGSFGGTVYSLDRVTGALKWRFKTVGHSYFPAGEVQGSPVLFGNRLFIGARDYNLYCLDTGKGFCHWNKVFTEGWVLSARVHDSVLYIAGADERVLAALDPLSGKELWKKKMEFLMFGKPAFYGQHLFIGTTLGKLHRIDQKTGTISWSFKSPSYETSHLKYLKEDDSYRDDIYQIITSNEQFLQVEEELGGFFSTPAVAEGWLIVSATDGNIFGFRLKEDF